MDKNICQEKYSIVNINRIWKNQDSRLSTEGGVSDIAILSKDFVFKDKEKGEVFAFIEVKAAGNQLKDTGQILGQRKKEGIHHYIYTNGIVWKYYFKENNDWKEKWKINLTEDNKAYSYEEVKINSARFKDLEKRIRNINWNEK